MEWKSCILKINGGKKVFGIFLRWAAEHQVVQKCWISCWEQHQGLNTAAATVAVWFHLIGKACKISPEYHLDAETSFCGLRGTSARSRSRYIGFPHSIKDLEQLSPGIKIRMILDDFGCRISERFGLVAILAGAPGPKIVSTDDSYS